MAASSISYLWRDTDASKGFRSGVSLHSHTNPVSYTHLDVYKRQVLIYSSSCASDSVNLISFPESSCTRKSRLPQGLRTIPCETRAPRS